MQKNEFYYPSADCETQIHAIEWQPDGRPVCILQIVHGMAEYIDRYDRLASFLNEKGILVTGHDHLGHGRSVYSIGGPVTDVGNNEHPYGYFCRENMVDTVISDVQKLREITQEKYPGVPYIIMGHSMGSFILRNYLCEYAQGLSGAIIMGTGMQPKKLLDVSLGLVKFLTVFQGAKHKSGLINVLAFGANNSRIKHPVSPMDWLSRDGVEVAKYNEDPLCGFTFTLNGFATLFELIDRLHDADRVDRMPRSLPVIFMSGKEDPVGEYGKAVEKLFQDYRAMGMQDVMLELYEEDRHEIVNEVDRELVFADIADWVLKKSKHAI